MKLIKRPKKIAYDRNRVELEMTDNEVRELSARIKNLLEDQHQECVDARVVQGETMRGGD